MANSDKKHDAEADETKARAEETAKKGKAAEPEKPKKSKLFTKPIKPGGGGFRAIVRK